MKRISILGSTGSIGRQTLDVILNNIDKFKIQGLSSGKNIRLLKEQILIFKPQLVCVQEEKDAKEIQDFIGLNGLNCDVHWGQKGLESIATDTQCELLIAAIVGTASIKPVYMAIQHRIPIALACKEILVSAGEIIMKEAHKNQVSILPLDSEHAAIKQCLAGSHEDLTQVKKVMITASGGPFRTLSQEDLVHVTPEQALKHPNWAMGSKISIDSATLMNKALEVIEAHHLFGLAYSKIEVIIHPQSYIHSAVEFIDGNIIAQIGNPDMRFPIQYALSYPEKIPHHWKSPSLLEMQSFTFEAPNHSRFPLLKFAISCGQKSGTWPVVMNAANEALVAQFLNKKIGFMQISEKVIDITNAYPHISKPSLDEIILIDQEIKTTLCN